MMVTLCLNPMWDQASSCWGSLGQTRWVDVASTRWMRPCLRWCDCVASHLVLFLRSRRDQTWFLSLTFHSNNWDFALISACHHFCRYLVFGWLFPLTGQCSHRQNDNWTKYRSQTLRKHPPLSRDPMATDLFVEHSKRQFTGSRRELVFFVGPNHRSGKTSCGSSQLFASRYPSFLAFPDETSRLVSWQSCIGHLQFWRRTSYSRYLSKILFWPLC